MGTNYLEYRKQQVIRWMAIAAAPASPGTIATGTGMAMATAAETLECLVAEGTVIQHTDQVHYQLVQVTS